MSKHALVFVHGMGTFGGGWSASSVATLRSAFSDYPSLANNFSFDDLFETVEVIYSDEFENRRQQWQSDFAAFKGALLGSLDPGDGNQQNKLANRLGNIETWIGAGEDNFVVTHALDVLLYRFFSTVRMATNVSVGRQVITVALNTAQFSSWNVIAHSLGTSVFHNTLHALYNTSLIPGQPPLQPFETRPRVIAMIANVSRVLQLPDVKVFESSVRPGSAMGGRGCGYYLNARHRLDPFTVPKPFEPDVDWVGPAVFNSRQYQHIRPGHILIDDIKAVHDLDHYLRNPRVHVPIFRAILGDDLVPDNEFNAAKSSFDSDIDAALQEKLRSKLEPMLPPPTGDWQTIIRLIKKGLVS